LRHLAGRQRSLLLGRPPGCRTAHRGGLGRIRPGAAGRPVSRPGQRG
jgi:hypothetical protein